MGAQGVVKGFVVVFQFQMRLGEIVIGFHVVVLEPQAVFAVGDGRFPEAELEARHGAVGEQGRVSIVGDDADRESLSSERGRVGAGPRDSETSAGEGRRGGLRLRIQALSADIVAGLKALVPFALQLKGPGGVAIHDGG